MLKRRKLMPLEDRCPLRVMFVITNMPVGGAEILLSELIRRMDRQRFSPEFCCLKELGPLGEQMAREVPGFSRLIDHKYDWRVLGRLRELFRLRQTDAVITVGTGGDKMFWGRLAAWLEGVPVITSALHSTGLPDRVERLNRLLTPVTDAFIGVAAPHGEYLARHEGCPRDKVVVIPNGVDVERFRPRWPARKLLNEFGLTAETPVVATVAALRPEKNHEMLLRVMAEVRRGLSEATLLIVGDGPCRSALERQAEGLGIADGVRFLGTRGDIPEILATADLFALTSHMEANPVSILEAMACEKPVVAPAVGSVPETVLPDCTGYLFPAGDEPSAAAAIVGLLRDGELAGRLGRAGREEVLRHWSIERMVEGYEQLITDIYERKLLQRGWRRRSTHAGRTGKTEPVNVGGGHSGV